LKLYEPISVPLPAVDVGAGDDAAGDDAGAEEPGAEEPGAETVGDAALTVGEEVAAFVPCAEGLLDDAVEQPATSPAETTARIANRASPAGTRSARGLGSLRLDGRRISAAEVSFLATGVPQLRHTSVRSAM
jgi:hypothetical protein